MRQAADQAKAAAGEGETRRRRARAIAAVIGASATFAVAAALVKMVAERIPTIEIVFFRSIIALVALWPMIARQGGLRTLTTRRPFWHVVRVTSGVVGMVTAFYGYAVLPIATVTALGFTMPLFLTALSIPLLRETVGIRRWSAVIVGFGGVLLILRPGGGEIALIPALIVVFGAFCWALAMAAIRRMGELGESNVTIIAWFSVGGAVVAGLAMIPVWVTPDWRDFTLLVLIGVISTGAQLLMTEAYRRAEASIVAPFEYVGILWTGLLGFVIWGERLSLWTLAGVVVLVASGLYILHREVVRRRER